MGIVCMIAVLQQNNVLHNEYIAVHTVQYNATVTCILV